MDSERALSVAEVAELFAVSRWTVARWAASGKLASWRTPSGGLRFRRSDVDALLPTADVEAAS